VPEFRIVRTSSSRPLENQVTAGSDLIRGSGLTEALVLRSLLPGEQSIVGQLQALDVPQDQIYDALLLGDLRRPLTDGEAANYPFLFDPAVADQFGFEVAATLDDALILFTTVLGSGPFDAGPAPDISGFGGADRIFGRGGDDYVADLAGDNLVNTDDGDDRILLGSGRDRIYDRGGDNRITDLGGDNIITTGDGDDTIETGDGDDVINAFDGRNVIDAGDGDNLVRGGDGYDEINVGTGDDFVELRGGTLGVFEPFDVAPIGITGFEAQNVIIDQGGSDDLRASVNSRNDQPGFPDQVYNGNDLVISDIGGVFGDDRIEVLGGDNIVLDLGGNDIVRTLEGDDIIFTSFVSPGNDRISSGAGDDFINPGGGADEVRSGFGADQIQLEFDGAADTLIFQEGDVSTDPTIFDTIDGFDGGGVDKIDLSALGATLADLLLLTVTGGRLVALDVNGTDQVEFGVDALIGVLTGVSGALTADSFIFADQGMV
jgi:Ca2+-binding RTX toxin-like protein